MKKDQQSDGKDNEGCRRKMKGPMSWKANEESTWKVGMTGLPSNCTIYYRKKSHMNVFVSRDRKYGVIKSVFSSCKEKNL